MNESRKVCRNQKMTHDEQQISDDERIRLRTHGVEENQWVRARILKRDPPPEGLLSAVERARGMSKNLFGARNPIYGESLVNCALLRCDGERRREGSRLLCGSPRNSGR